MSEQVCGFVKALGQQIVNGSGETFTLEGVGLGGWLLPEGYMWQFPKEGDRPRKMEAFINKSIGEEKANIFWKNYRSNFITENDISLIKEEGFNSVRVPFNSRLLLNDSSEFSYLDNVIEWCEKHKLYVILDMHGAPGGQTGTNIDDSERDVPELFTSEVHWNQTVALWENIARRYKDRWIIAGYDLLNEPLPEWFSKYNDKVIPLYKEIIKAIRSVDKDHMIILEGVHWSTDWSIFNEKLDDNLMIQFHKYWNNPDTESIEKYLTMQKKLNVPIYMGEGGENNINWYSGAFHLFDEHNISWNFWTYKKMNNTNSLLDIKKPSGWDLLSDAIATGECLSADKTEEILDEFIKLVNFKENKHYPDVSRALLRKPGIKVPAIFYDYKGEAISYQMTNRAKGSIGFRLNDDTDISFIESDKTDANFSHGGGEKWKNDDRMKLTLEEGEWVHYTFNIDESGDYNVVYCQDSHEDTGVCFSINDINMIETMNPVAWKPLMTEKTVKLVEGKTTLKVLVFKGCLNIEYITLEKKEYKK